MGTGLEMREAVETPSPSCQEGESTVRSGYVRLLCATLIMCKVLRRGNS